MFITNEELSFRQRIYKKPKLEDKVQLVVVEMEDIPVNSNPFRYDSFNMGSEIARGWTIMHAGNMHKDNPVPLEYIKLINGNTGQRIHVEMRPVTEIPEEIISYYPAGGFTIDTRIGVGPFYVPYLSTEGKGSIEWRDLRDPRNSALDKVMNNPYICMGDYFVRWDIFKQKEVFIQAVRDTMFSSEEFIPSDELYQAKVDSLVKTVAEMKLHFF